MNTVLQSSRADLFLLIYFASGILLLPVWIRISKRVGKKNAWLASMAVNTCAFSGVYFLGAGDEWAYAVLVAVPGMGFGATLALPSAIQADAIDYDELLTGRRQEGWYIGIRSVVKKLAAAVGVGAGLTLLGMSGYAPGTEQTPEAIQYLKVLYALVPSACNAVAFAIDLTFSISQSVHQRILENIALLKQGREAADPLKPSHRGERTLPLTGEPHQGQPFQEGGQYLDVGLFHQFGQSTVADTAVQGHPLPRSPDHVDAPVVIGTAAAAVHLRRCPSRAIDVHHLWRGGSHSKHLCR